MPIRIEMRLFKIINGYGSYLAFNIFLNGCLHLFISYFDKYNIKRELKGIETVGEKEAYKVEITYPTSRTETQYFDVETGLRIKLISENGVTEIADYREVSKVKFPFSIKQTSGPQSFDMKVLSVKVNSKLKDDLFKVN